MPGEVQTLHLVLLIAALFLSGFFSSSETAFMSLQRIRLRHLERIGERGVVRVRRLADQADRTLVTILIGNNLVNTGAAALGTVIVANLLGPAAAVPVATLGVTLLLLVFGEITPKTVAIRHSERMALLYSVPIEALTRLFAPLAILLGWLGSAVARLVGGPAARSILSPEEIRTVIMMGEEAGVLHREETELLYNVLRLEDLVVREVMVPRTDVVGVPAEQTVADVARLVAARGYTQMPVYEGDLDHIAGVVHVKDVLVRYAAGEADLPVRRIMRTTLFVPDTKTVSSLLQEMRERNTQLAVVIDEYGGTAGIVSLEDLLEEVVGEITSEYGAERRLVQRRSDTEMIVDAAIAVEDVNEAFDVELPTEEVDTLGGFVLQQLGRIPQRGERFQYQDLEFTVVSMSGRRVGIVRILKEHQRPDGGREQQANGEGQDGTI